MELHKEDLAYITWQLQHENRPIKTIMNEEYPSARIHVVMAEEYTTYAREVIHADLDYRGATIQKVLAEASDTTRAFDAYYIQTVTPASVEDTRLHDYHLKDMWETLTRSIQKNVIL